MKLEQGTIKHLQEYVKHQSKARGFDDETLQEHLVLLMEEVGELAKAARKQSGMYVEKGKREKYGDVGTEAADVLNILLAIVNDLEIDFEAEYLKKEKKNDERFGTYSRG